MPLYIVIAAAVTIAVTAKFMHLVFLSGKTITNHTFFGRLVSRIEPARRAFVDGWRRRSWRYLFVAWPCMLFSMALVSLLLKWMMPALDNAQTFGDKIRYSLLVFSVGVSASLSLAFVLVMLAYYCGTVIKFWWQADGAKDDEGEAADGTATAGEATE